ncbi:hypothetical protein BDZ89DRAFT_1144469 [Hymenopellis radicata]|nr:hypothetical protein BDZ89DRAFT_1144469 [Hymenopellis radicata]
MTSKTDCDAGAGLTLSVAACASAASTPRSFQRVTSEQEVELIVEAHDTTPLTPRSSVEFIMPPPVVSRAAPPTYAAALTPDGYVYDRAIHATEYVPADFQLRTGRLFNHVPSGPLAPTLISANSDGTKTHFYCILVGLQVGVITDANEASACVQGVTGGFHLKKHSQRIALDFFNAELAKGNVRIGHLRKPRSAHLQMVLYPLTP